MKKGLLTVAALAMSLVPMSTPAMARGVVVVRSGFYGGGFYAPFWGPYWGPAYAGPYYAYPNSGEVKLDTKVKDAQVFINGSFAGTTHQNKTMRLRPGNYKLEIREGGQTRFAEQIYVVPGKTLKLYPEL